jgi:hypothetical protein
MSLPWLETLSFDTNFAGTKPITTAMKRKYCASKHYIPNTQAHQQVNSVVLTLSLKRSVSRIVALFQVIRKLYQVMRMTYQVRWWQKQCISRPLNHH